MTTIISRLAGRYDYSYVCMVKFFVQLYSSDDYFVWFYCIGDRPRRRRRREGEGREGFNSNIKRIIPALLYYYISSAIEFALYYTRARSGFGDANFTIRSRKFGYFRILSLCFLLIIFEYAFDWEENIWNLKDWM